MSPAARIPPALRRGLRATAALRVLVRCRGLRATAALRVLVRCRGLRAAAPLGMLAVAALALQALALPARAQASAYSAVERAYAQDGTVPPCRFSTAVLEQALKQAPTYDQEYFGDFIGAVQSALRERAGGACASHRTSGAARAVGPSGPLPPEPPLPPSITSPTAASIPWPLLVALGLLVAGCAGAAGVAVARSRGWDPRWAEAARHAWREAEWRAGGAWEAVRDRWRRPLSR